MLSGAVPAPDRPDPGVRVELQRREPARARVGARRSSTASSGRWPATGGEPTPTPTTSTFLAEAFSKLLRQLHLVGQPQGPQRQATCSRAASSAWTTSGSSTAARASRRGGTLEQSDGTAWMAFFSQNMLEIAIALSEHDPAYEGFIVKFVHHWFQIAMAMDPLGEHPDEMWDEEDGFFYDVLRLPDGTGRRIEVRSLVGPAAAVRDVGRCPQARSSASPTSPREIARLPRPQRRPARRHRRPARARCRRPSAARPRRRAQAAPHPREDARRGAVPRRRTASARSPSGTRSTRTPFERRRAAVHGALRAGRVRQRDVRRQLQLARPGVGARSTCCSCARCCSSTSTTATSSGSSARPARASEMTLYEVAEELSDRLVIDVHPRRATVAGRCSATPRSSRPTRRGATNILFYEYFHGDNGAGIGASHQTGWTGVVARLAQLFASTDAQTAAARAEPAVHRPLPPADGPAAGQRRHRTDGPLTGWTLGPQPVHRPAASQGPGRAGDRAAPDSVWRALAARPPRRRPDAEVGLRSAVVGLTMSIRRSR